MTKPHALVVGGTKGLGRVVADRFLARGCTVTTLSRNAPGSALPDGMHHIAADLETLDNAGAIVAEALETGGPLSYLLLCQRYRGTGDPWTGEIQVGLTASRLLIDEFAPFFHADGDRAIGVVSSVYADFVGSEAALVRRHNSLLGIGTALCWMISKRCVHLLT